MANTLKNTFSGNDKIQQGNIINAHHVSQSVDALTGTSEYDITVRGTISVQAGNGGQTFKFDGNNFGESESDAFLVRNADGTIGYRTGGAQGPQGAPGTHGTSGTSGSSGIGGTGTSGSGTTSGTSGTSGTTPLPLPPTPSSSGSSGTSGISGTPGNNGSPGSSGSSGTSGTSYSSTVTSNSFTMALNRDVTTLGNWNFEVVGNGVPTAVGRVTATTANKSSISSIAITKANVGGDLYGNTISKLQSDFETTTLRLRGSGDFGDAEYKILTATEYNLSNPPYIQYGVQHLNGTGNINTGELAEFDFYNGTYVYSLSPGYLNLIVTANNTYSNPQPDYPELCFYLDKDNFDEGEESIVNLQVSNRVKLTYMAAGGQELATGTVNKAGQNLSPNWRRRTCQIITGNSTGLNTYGTNNSGEVNAGRYQLYFKHWSKNGGGQFGAFLVKVENNGFN